jgi:tetratricopeptide (TPR) repeat protein
MVGPVTVSRTGNVTAGVNSIANSGVLIQHVHPPGRQKADGPVRVGAPPMLADRYQPRPALTDRFDQTVSATGTVVLTQVLAGTGGVGKTQLAAHYAATRWPDPGLRLAMWVSARSRDAIVSAYAQAAVELLGADPTTPAQAADRLLAWLASRSQQWLIVLDDLQRPDDLHHLWPPAAEQGRTVVTTRRRDPSLVRADRPLIDVGVFTSDEAHTYLTAKLTDYPHLADGLDGLAADLGYLPLALAQAVAYLANRDFTCQDYRARFADQSRTLRQVLPSRGELPDDHDQTVDVTLALSLDLANREQPLGLAGPVMQVASLLDPASIPSALFHTEHVRTHLSTLLDRDVETGDIDEVLTVLHRLSLITLDRQAPQREVRVHALAQRATREHPDTSPTVLATAARVAADALEAIWPAVERDTVLIATLRSNTQTLHTIAEDALWTPGGHTILFRTGKSLREAGLFTDAITYFDQLLTLAHTHLGPDHPDTLANRNNLAYSRGEAGDPTGAVTAYAELLTDYLRILGPDDPDTLTTRNNLARWRGQAGDAAGAVTAFAELLTDQLRVLGHDHPRTLTARSNLAHWRGEAGDPAGAVTAYAELLTDYLRILGPDDPDTLTTRNNLASWRRQAGDPAGAATAYAELLTDQLRVLGHDHPHTLTTRSNLARWRGEAGDPAGAATAYAELLTDRLRVLGHDHPHTLTNRHNLAHWRGEAGDAAGAVTAFAELLTDYLRILGPDHPRTRIAQTELTYWQQQATESVT